MSGSLGFGRSGSKVPAWQSGQWYHLPGLAAATNQVGNGVARVYAQWLAAGTLSSALVGISAIGNAGSVFRPLIYANATGDIPGKLQIDFGTIDVGTSTTLTALTGSWVIPYSGWWWCGGVVQGAATTQPTLYTCSGGASGINVPATWGGTAPAAAASPSCAYSMSGLTGVAGAPDFTVGGVAGFAPRLMLKAA